MSEWIAKRFWTDAAVVQTADGFVVQLDGRGIKTPAKRALVLPSRAMADAVAAEWQAQEEVINPNTLPVTKTANAAIDKVMISHAEVADMLAAYGDSDLLCYRADTPAALVQRQNDQWNPLLEWAAQDLNASLQLRTGVIHAPQDPEQLKALTARTHALSAFQLAAFHDLVSLSGSLVIGFAAALNHQSAQILWNVSRLDEIWQIEQWGVDDEAEALAALKKESFLHAKRMFDISTA
jgi:chaperone required for assembly of F1-ATPase